MCCIIEKKNYFCRIFDENMIENNSDTICALSSPAGVGAISIVRLSGNDSVEIASSIISSPVKLVGSSPRVLHFAKLINESGDILDEVLITKFLAPNSFTGEDMVEIFCHGSEYIQTEILSLLVRKGASIALPGEFTKRAFLNNKMDLAQSEAVADLISSGSKESHRIAINQMKGQVSNEIIELRERMIGLISLLELELDFGEEDVEFADRSELQKLTTEILDKVSGLIETFKYGNAIKSGVPVAIAGKPNAGKSTLLNSILKDDRAIVSSIPGTTRDTVEESIVLDGIKFKLIDTAGIRKSEDEIEKIGVERTLNKIGQSQIIVLIIDSTADDEENLNFVKDTSIQLSEDQFLVIALNKTDIVADFNITHYEEFGSVIKISAKTALNIDVLCSLLTDYVKSLKQSDASTIISNVRHIELFNKAHEALTRAKEAIASGISGDFVSQDLREAMYYLGEITGTISNEEVLGAIFSKFCIGK